MPEAPVVVWFRQDLRIADQSALFAAARSGRPVVPLYVLDDGSPGAWRIGGASRWWLHGSLESLAAELARLGSPLILRRGEAAQTVGQVVRECGAGAVYATRHAEPFWCAAEDRLRLRLSTEGVTLEIGDGTTLFPPGGICGRDGRPLRVFTPFWKACLAAPEPPRPLPAPDALRPPSCPVASDALASWGLLPSTPDWAGGLRETWRPGEAGAHARLHDFVEGDLRHYRQDRNRPEPTGTSMLSAHLHAGEVSARQVWHCVQARAQAVPQFASGAESWLRELGWREFCAHVLAMRPELPEQPLQPRFAAFPWRNDPKALAAWQRGRTGYPIVDAGMRQLWRTGWMHNRVRMITASFLVKHLLVPWQQGEAWFWDTLVDADLANNAGGWQWVAGCGTDAAPYFRIFNPVLQGEKFDPDGAYVRRWVPELARVPAPLLHKPWQAAPLELESAGVRLGHDYPAPLVDHAQARARALSAFSGLPGGAADVPMPRARSSAG